MKVKVIRTFRDKDNFDLIYNVGKSLTWTMRERKNLLNLIL